MKQILLIAAILLISKLTYSQEVKLTWIEKYRLYNQAFSDSIDSNIAIKVQDSLILKVLEFTGEDIERDTTLWAKIEKQVLTDSIRLDTFDIYIMKIVMRRGGELIIVQSENNPVEGEKFKQNIFFNMLEVENYMAKTRNFPCDLIENIFVHYKLSGQSGLLNLKYKLACNEIGYLQIINREEFFKIR